MVGLIERFALAARYAITGDASAAAQWFGPHQPLDPTAPPAVEGRRFDFRAGINLAYRPGDDEGIDFAQLRALADNFGLVRLVVETRKDQLAWREWEIRPRKGCATRPDDPAITAITSFLETPDMEHDWETWLRALVEDMLVIDAATIFPRRTGNGELYSLDLIDGATIGRVIDPWGRTPTPPAAAYQQVLHGLPAVDYDAKSLLYLPRNYRTNRIYGFSPVEQILVMINIAMRREMHKLEYYTSGTVPDALAGVPMTWNPDQIADFQEYFDTLLSDNLAQRRKIRFVPETIAKAFVETKGAVLKDDFDEWIARFVCYAFSVSSQWAVKMMNRSTAESAAQQATEEGLAPLQGWVRNVMTRTLRDAFLRPDLEFCWKEDQAVDPAEQSEIDDRDLRNASRTLNQVRASRGDDPVQGGDEPLIYTAVGAVPLKDVLNPPAPTPATPAVAGPDPSPDGDDDGRGGGKGPGGGGRSSGGSDNMSKAAEGESPEQSLEMAWADYLGGQAGQANGFFLTLAARGEDPNKAAISAAADPSALAEAAIDAAATAIERRQLVERTARILLSSATDAINEGLGALESTLGNGGAEAGIVMGPAEVADITNLAHPEAVEYAETRAAQLVSRIDETTRNQLRTLIANAQKEGWSADRLAGAVHDMGGFGPVRAEMIARTELAASSIRGNLAAWTAAANRLGLGIRKRVILGINEQHCAACEDAVREGAIPLSDSWGVGFAPPFHPRCGCDLVPEVIRDEEGRLESRNFPPRERHGERP